MIFKKAKEFLKKTCSEESISIFDDFFDFLQKNKYTCSSIKVESSIKKYNDGRESKNRYCFTLGVNLNQAIGFLWYLAEKKKINQKLCSESGEVYNFIKNCFKKTGILAAGVDYSIDNKKIIKFYFEDGGGQFGESIIIVNGSDILYKKYNLVYHHDYGKLIERFYSIGISQRDIFKTAAVYDNNGKIQELHFILRNKKFFDSQSYISVIAIKNESTTYYITPIYV